MLNNWRICQCNECCISDFGPVKETDDPKEFMLFMENLMALGGGDEPEMCLSALQVAMTDICGDHFKQEKQIML